MQLYYVNIVYKGLQLLSQHFWEKITQRFRAKDPHTPVTIPRPQHSLSRQNISKNAVRVLYTLKDAGFSAYLVGGGVRDVLIKKQPKDYDVVTDALPEEIHKLFRNSRLIGRRFRLVHVFFKKEIIEVSTFRANVQEAEDGVQTEIPTRLRSENTYGTIEEDAWRRDFTVNALYYNIEDFSIVDYTGGMLDLKRKTIRMIGEPLQRYHEDPVRLLRAIRLAAKLNFKIHSDTEAPLKAQRDLLTHVPPSRLFDEMLKLFFTGHAKVTYDRLDRYGYLDVLFPSLKNALAKQSGQYYARMLELALKATDERFSVGKSLNPGFLMSVFLWPELMRALEIQKSQHKHFYQALHAAIDEVLSSQKNTLVLPRRLTVMMRSVWVIQYRFEKRSGARVYRLLEHRYFRAAYDFLELRAKAGDQCKTLERWWASFQFGNAQDRERLLKKAMKKR